MKIRRAKPFLAAPLAGSLMIGAAAWRRGGTLRAQPPSPGVTSQVGFDQNLGARVPLEAALSGRIGAGAFPRRALRKSARDPGACLLSDAHCFADRFLTGLTRGLKPLTLEAGKDFDVVAFSINPEETPALAASKRSGYLERYDRPGSERGWHFLTGDEASITALSRAIGFRFTRRCPDQTLCPCRGPSWCERDGVISRYFFGIEFPPNALQVELERARAGHVGSPIARMLLLCYDYDQATGKYTLSIVRLIRVLGTGTARFARGLLARDVSP